MIVDLQATDAGQAIDELVEALAQRGKIQARDRAAIKLAVKEREASMSTGIGYGIAIPHASTALVSQVVYIGGRSRSGIPFKSLDQQPVHRVVLFLVPADQPQKHAAVLGEILSFTKRIDL
ncbi:MAG TPA: PTS sugar transporter subunit IIA [Verrucomicrobiae bacterium]